MDKLVFIIDEENLHQRLDKFVSDNTDLSRNYTQALIDEERILVNGEKTKTNYKVKLNDEIVIDVPQAKELDLTPVDLNLEIVYEDSDLLIVNKPRGLVVHPAPGHYEHTLVHGVLHHCKDLSAINGVYRPGIVHRIDKDTSGLLIICKNDVAHNAIAAQLANKTCTRKYMTLVHGVIPHEYGTIDAPIGRDDKNRQKMCVTAKNSKEAITKFKVVKRYQNYTLVELSLKTGRTHQIRVHMQYIKFPVVGDQKYSYKKTLETNGQVLHAYELEFVHPTTNEMMKFTIDLPDYFKDVLAQIEEAVDA